MQLTSRLIINKVADKIGVAGNADARKNLAKTLPRAVRDKEGLIFTNILPHVAGEISYRLTSFDVAVKPQEVSDLLREAGVISSQELDLGNLYQAILKEHETVLGDIARQESLKHVDRRFLALQHLVQRLGLEPSQNRSIATKCIREALGYSGVRVYTVDLENRNWFHRHAEGHQGRSRFNRPGRPKEQSEKYFLTRLLRSEVKPEGIEERQQLGLIDFYRGQDWGYLYIPDRTKCDFVEVDQVQRDEAGDAEQSKEGYGEGAAREMFFLFVGKPDARRREVYLITNWEAQKPLFADREQDLELLRTFATSLARSNDLADVHQKLRDLSERDELMGIYNRRFFNEILQIEFDRARRFNHPLSLLMIDIDHFKEINDNYGHPAGDEVLRRVAQVLGGEIRNVDILCRYGGEEIAVILPETNGEAEGVYVAAERLRSKIEGLNIPIEINGGGTISINITISIGTSTYNKGSVVQSAGDLIMRADQALYQAKDRGRNQVLPALE